MGTITVQEGQSLFDIAVQACGAVAAVFAVAALNGLAITDTLAAGQKLVVPESYDRRISEYYALNNLRPATGTDDAGMETIRASGIGYWAIWTEFEVR